MVIPGIVQGITYFHCLFTLKERLGKLPIVPESLTSSQHYLPQRVRFPR